MFFAVIVILLAIIIPIAFMTFQQNWKFRKVRQMPGPTAYPLLGNALEFGLTPVAILNDLARLARKYGNIYKVKLGPINTYLIISDPELTEFFISSPRFLQKTWDYDRLRPWIANGLITSTGSYWQKRRKIITPTFHFKILEQFIPIFNSGTNILIKKLSTEVDKDICDVYPFITAYTLDSVCETAMGVTVNAQEDPNNKYVASVKSICSVLVKRIFSPLKQFNIFFQFTNDFQIQNKNLEVIHGFTKSVIKKRHQELLDKDNETTSSKVEDDIGAKKKQAILDLLLQSTIDGKPLTDDDICEEVDSFMFAGHDTTGSAISFALYELSRNKEIQQKAYEEVKVIYHDDKNYEPNITELNNLKYLELVIKETLRLYPSVPYYGRELTEDVEHNGTVYPKGLSFFFFPFYMHRRADLFPNPEKFDPERFTAENSVGRNPFAYIPFSAGPRNCIGQRFAMYEMKTVLAKILLHFKLLRVDPKYDIVLSAELILKSANGMRMQLKKR